MFMRYLVLVYTVCELGLKINSPDETPKKQLFPVMRVYACTREENRLDVVVNVYVSMLDLVSVGVTKVDLVWPRLGIV